MTNGLMSGFHHVATISRDLERTIAFYVDVFDAQLLFDLVAPGLDYRHVGLDLGGAFLHAWEIPEDSTGPFPAGMFERGRVDHFALAAKDEQALEVLRGRLVDAGACEGNVSDFGSMLSVWFVDPDGLEAEVCSMKEGTTWSDARDPVPEAEPRP